MGQLRTANKRRNRAIIAAQAIKSGKTAPAAEPKTAKKSAA
jgi:hypothetical protein